LDEAGLKEALNGYLARKAQAPSEQQMQKRQRLLKALANHTSTKPPGGSKA
jgi:hypothetical protein